jgi:hypothetical protein
MKRVQISLILVAIVLLVISCYKDKGNYDISPVHEVEIGGPSYNLNNYSLQQQDTLKIDPVYSFIGDTTGLVFKWYLMRQGVKTGDSTIRLIGTEQQLAYKVQSPIGAYTVQLSIEDPKNSLVKSRIYGLNVRLKAAQGFLVLNTKPDQTQDIDVILDNTKPEVYYEVFSTNNTFPLKDATKLTMIQSMSNIYGLLYVFLQNGGYTLRPSFDLLQDAPYWFYDQPAKVAPTAIYQDAFGNNNYLINNGKIHSTRANNAPLLFTYQASGDYIAGKSLLMGTYAFIYDQKNHRFVRYNKAAGAVFPITKNNEDLFNVDSIGNKDCFLFDHTMQPSAAPSPANFSQLKPIAYCKDRDTKKVYVYKFGFFRSLATYAESVKEVSVASFVNASAYVNASNNPLTYYAHENKIYVYDFNNDVSREVYSFSESGISIDQLKTNGSQLMAAVNHKSTNTGEVYFFKINAAGNISDNNYFSKYGGFGKIVDVEYKYNVVNMMGVAWK